MVPCAMFYRKEGKFTGKSGTQRMGTDYTENRKRYRKKCGTVQKTGKRKNGCLPESSSGMDNAYK